MTEQTTDSSRPARRDPVAGMPRLSESDREQLAELQRQRLEQLGSRPVHWLRKRR
jgi:hypothetical protein